MNKKYSVMNFDIPESTLKEIETAIASDESVVGIDAKKTHIIIIHMLRELGDRLEQIENRLESLEEEL